MFKRTNFVKNFNFPQAIDTKAILKQAFFLSLKPKLFILVGLLFKFLLMLSMVYFVFDISSLNINSLAQEITTKSMLSDDLFLKLQIFSLVMVCLLAPIKCALDNGALGIVNNEKISIFYLFSYVKKFLSLITLALLLNFITELGFSLMLIPGFIIAVLSSVSYMCLIKFNLNVIQAFMLSVRGFFKFFFVVFGLFIIAIALLMLSVFTFGIGFIFSVPFYYYIKALLFKEIFLSLKDEKNQADVKEKILKPSKVNENSFEA